MSKAHTIWLSDIHLGNPNCQYEKLYEFLKSLENDDGTYNLTNLYLVGDIIDMTQFNHKVFWGKHRTIIKKFFRMADKGVNIIYIRGNHDYMLEQEFLKENPKGVSFNKIEFKYNDTYTSLSGKKYFVLHGDEFDGIIRLYPFSYKIGDLGYKFIIFLNRIQNSVRRRLGIKPWSFAQWIKGNVKKSIQYVNNYEDVVADKAKEENVDGIICGHIHNAADKYIGEVRYLNCGCWVEFCSYIIEDETGKITKVIYYHE
jgi:UDP-2,3-diacylglucosamine pyrophosphatase LpxH